MEKEVKNLTAEDTQIMSDRFNELLMSIYKKKITSTRRLDFDKLHIIYPGRKTYILDIKYLKNAKKLLSYYFANIEKKPFTDKRHNIHTFEILWILIGILDMLHGLKFKNKPLYANLSLLENTIQFGKYIFTIPKYKQFIFDVKGINLAQLTIV